MRALHGRLSGNTILLDDEVELLDGQTVRVTIEPLPSPETRLSAEHQAQLWQEWIAHGPQGPIEAA